jgi:hypothetical protein
VIPHPQEEAGAAKILMDPFLSDNPSWDKGWIGYHRVYWGWGSTKASWTSSRSELEKKTNLTTSTV